MTFPVRAFLVAVVSALGLGLCFGIPAGTLVAPVVGAYPQGDAVLAEGGGLLGLEAARHLGHALNGAARGVPLAALLGVIVAFFPTGAAAIHTQRPETGVGEALGVVVSRFPGLAAVWVSSVVARTVLVAIGVGLAMTARGLASTDRGAALVSVSIAAVMTVPLAAVRFGQDALSASHVLGRRGFMQAMGGGIETTVRVLGRGTLFAWLQTTLSMGVVVFAAAIPTRGGGPTLLLHVLVVALLAATRVAWVAWVASCTQARV